MINTAVIFCGGKATRFNNGKPGPLKPLLKVNGISILRRIIDIYIKDGVTRIILLGGYKIDQLKKIRIKNKKIQLIILNTGLNTETGGRLLSLKKILKKNELFFLTYGDSLADFNPSKALKLFLKNKSNSLISCYVKKNNYGTLIADEKRKFLSNFFEKKEQTLINAGFYIMNASVIRLIKSKKESFEKKTLPKLLLLKNKIILYRCKFWYPMDNAGDRLNLNTILKR